MKRFAIFPKIVVDGTSRYDKVTSMATNIKNRPHYIFLESGDILQPGDEWHNPDDNTWSKTGGAGNQILDTGLAYRRLWESEFPDAQMREIQDHD